MAWAANEPILIFEIVSTFIFLSNVVKGSYGNRMGFGWVRLYFGVSCRVGHRYWARGSGPWAVRVAKKSAQVISSKSPLK